ncbi:MAG: hypothetical protein Kow0079_06140 [Vicingaceae bacterium]
MLYIVFKEDCDISIKDIEEIITVRKELQKGKKSLTLVDIRGLWHVDKNARELAASDAMIQHNIALAIISSSLSTKIIGNFYMKFDKPNVPTKMFNNEKDALLWLSSFKS